MSPEITNCPARPIGFTEVTLRDGEQQNKVQPFMWVEDRLDVFDEIVATGIDRVEIGHLGNEHDVNFAGALVKHITEKSQAGDERYDNVSLQVLFGSQVELLDEGISALDGFDPDRVVVHVYDRSSPNLRGLAAEPYSTRESAERVIDAARVAIERGYTNFSISGEGTVDPDLSIDEAVNDFYIPIIDSLQAEGAASINVNLPNTFGSSLGGEWDETGLGIFNDAIKDHAPEVTTSIHVHNDYSSASEYALAAVRAGFDRIEGTITGMGERAGNVSLADVMVLMLESGRAIVEARERQRQRVGRVALRHSVWDERHLARSIVDNLENWYRAGHRIGTIYGTMNRFHKTALGNEEAYGAGSGPHAHANQEFLRDPVNKPLWRNYGRAAIVHAMMGRPEAWQIVEVDPERIRQITLATHAAGGSTERILAEEIEECDDEARTRAIQNAKALMNQIAEVVSAPATQPAEHRPKAFATA